MRAEHLPLLACPKCRGDLALGEAVRDAAGWIESGALTCAPCGKRFPIEKHIPRFVPRDNYASGFGFEWKQHARTQYDSHSGANISEKRFFNETKWPRRLEGQMVLEVGSGSGRFTEQAAATGATVVSFDYSDAVEVNYSSNGAKSNVLIIQADVYELPLRKRVFDKVFCFGVLQHTPDPEGAFRALPRYLKAGGQIAADIYRRRKGLRGLLSRLVPSQYWVRPFTRGMEPEKLYRRCRAYVHFMWPFARVIGKVPKLGHWLNWRLVIADYRGVYDLPDEALREWAVLDTFDMLSPKYDYPQSPETFRRWFEEAGLGEIEVMEGYNGIEGRAQAGFGHPR